jgi:hypothetical protein
MAKAKHVSSPWFFKLLFKWDQQTLAPSIRHSAGMKIPAAILVALGRNHQRDAEGARHHHQTTHLDSSHVSAGRCRLFLCGQRMPDHRGGQTNKWALAYMGRSLSRTTTALRNKMRAKGFTRAGRRAVKAVETVPAFGIGLSHDGNRI